MLWSWQTSLLCDDPIIMKILLGKVPVSGIGNYDAKRSRRSHYAVPGTRAYASLFIAIQYYMDAKWP